MKVCLFGTLLPQSVTQVNTSAFPVSCHGVHPFTDMAPGNSECNSKGREPHSDE